MAEPRQPAATSRPRRPTATTPEERENQLINLAVDLAEEQIRSGSASAQVITHFLKLATYREQLEREKLRNENELLRARVESLASSARTEELYSEAIEAMRKYNGQGEVDDYADY